MQEAQINEKEPKVFRKILSNSFMAAIAGGILSFLFLSASPENALEFGSKGTSALHGGLGLIGFLGSIIWNFLISVFGALFFGFITAIGSLIYYSMPRKRKSAEQ